MFVDKQFCDVLLEGTNTMYVKDIKDTNLYSFIIEKDKNTHYIRKDTYMPMLNIRPEWFIIGKDINNKELWRQWVICRMKIT